MIAFPGGVPLEGRMYGYILPGALTLLFLYVSKIIYGALLSPASRVPGPLLARFTRLWELNAVHRGDFERTNLKLHEKYGTQWHSRPNLMTTR